MQEIFLKLFNAGMSWGNRAMLRDGSKILHRGRQAFSGIKTLCHKPKNVNFVKVPKGQTDPKLVESIFSKAEERVSDDYVAELLSRPMPDISLRGEINAYAKPLKNWIERKIVKPFQYLKRRGFKTGNKTEGPVTVPANDLPPDVYRKIYIEDEGAKQLLKETEKIYVYRR